jgi:AraC-like DNA-binding protein
MTGDRLVNFGPIEWRSQRDIRVSPEGKHLIEFPNDFPLAISAVVYTTGFRNTPNYHDYFEISWIANGSGKFNVGKKTYPVEPDDLFVNGNSDLHLLESDRSNLIRCVNVYFLPDLIFRPGGNMLDFEYLGPFYVQSIEFSNRIPHGSPPNRRIVELMARMNHALVEKREHHRLEAKNALCEILLALRVHYGQFPVVEGVHPSRRQKLERLKRVFQDLREHYQEKISLDHLAEVAYMSPSYLCRFFKMTTNYTLKEYLHRIRVDLAKELLIEGKLPITQIGLEVGFESHSYFDRVFRRLTGVSPREYGDQSGSLSPPK